MQIVALSCLVVIAVALVSIAALLFGIHRGMRKNAKRLRAQTRAAKAAARLDEEALADLISQQHRGPSNGAPVRIPAPPAAPAEEKQPS